MYTGKSIYIYIYIYIYIIKLFFFLNVIFFIGDVKSKENSSDLLTKSLTRELISSLSRRMSLKPLKMKECDVITLLS
jgi:hypothetical protein